jgi:hypothetical protein
MLMDLATEPAEQFVELPPRDLVAQRRNLTIDFGP